MAVRQDVAFPTVGKIRKGLPKERVTKVYGSTKKEIEIFGKDLKNKFRIEILPGVSEETQKKIHSAFKEYFVEYPKNYLSGYGYELPYIRATIPTKKALDGFRWTNEVYNKTGICLARADGEKYTFKRNPSTLEIEIENGEPFEKFDISKPIIYDNNGSESKLKLKSSAVLNLWLPQVKGFVNFELKTTSYIDSLNMYRHLLAVQNVADMINGGFAGRIPLDIYRVEQEIPYISGGSGHRSKQWMIQIKVNDEWAEKAIEEMNKFPISNFKFEDFAPPSELSEITEELIEENDDAEEGASVESVAEIIKGEVSEQNVQEEPEDEITKAQNIIIELYREIKKKNKELGKEAGKVLKEYEPEIGDIRKVNDKALLKECWKKLNKINKEIDKNA